MKCVLLYGFVVFCMGNDIIKAAKVDNIFFTTC